MWALDLRAEPSLLRRRQLGERDCHSGRCCLRERGDQRLAAVVGGIELVIRSREVDGYEAQRTAAGQRLEQGALVLEGTRETVRHGSGRWRPERIGQQVGLSRRIGLVQARLRHDDRPIRMPVPGRTDDVQHFPLLDIERLDNGHDQMRAALAKTDVLAGIVGDLAEPAGVEKADDGRFIREIEHARGLRAGAKAAADLGVARLRQHANDRGLAALHLAEQPDHRGEPARALGDGRLRVG